MEGYKEFKIQLKEVENVKNFVAIVSEYDSVVDVISGKYCVDGKSLLGLFSMDLSTVLTVRIYEKNASKERDLFNRIDALGIIVAGSVCTS